MRPTTAHLFVFPGFADWEPAHALAELRRSGGYRTETIAHTLEPVESMGGLRVSPSRTLADVDPEEVGIVILPGGDRWEEGAPDDALTSWLDALDGAGTPIAAICGATVGIVRAGLLRGRRHTSNGLAYLKTQVPDYTDDARYVDQPAVREGGLITANGLADVEFAGEIMAELDVLTADEREEWTGLFRSGRVPPAWHDA